MEVRGVASSRIAAKRTDLECIHCCLAEAAVFLQQLAMTDQHLYTGIVIPHHLVYDVQYFRDLTAGIINNAPKAN